MSVRLSWIVTCLAVMLGGLAQPAAGQPPSARNTFALNRIEPGVAAPGDRVTVSDNALNTNRVRVTVDGVPATIVAALKHRVTFTVPTVRPGDAVVLVSSSGGRVGRTTLRIRAAVPDARRRYRIECVEPAIATPGTRVTISDRRLNPSQLQVTVNGVAATIVHTAPHRVTFVVPNVAPGRATIRASRPGSRTGIAKITIQSTVTVDGASTVSATINASGGILRTTQGGRRYTLSIPESALAQPVPISIAPVISINGFPFAEGLIAGVRFEPDGVQFAQPAVLTIEGLVPPPVNPAVPHALMAFSVDAAATTYRALPISNDGGLIRVTVPHFSAAVVANASIADFERVVRPILNALPANASPQVVQSLVFELSLWLERFGMDLCNTTTLCRDIFAKGVAALQTEISATVGRMNTHVAAKEPFLALNDMAIAVQLYEMLIRISLDADATSATGYELTVSLDPLRAPISSLVLLGKTQAIERVRLQLFELLRDVFYEAALLGLETESEEAGQALGDSFEALLVNGRQTCTTDADAGETILVVGLADDAADVRELATRWKPEIEEQLEVAWAECRIHVTPNPGSVAMFEDLQFTGTVVGLPGGLSWQIDGITGDATIDANGLFSGANFSGTLTIVATSQSSPTRYRRIPLEIVDTSVTVAPATTTIDVGKSQQFTATVVGPKNTAVTWSATGGTIDASTGLFSSAVEGTFTIRATSVLNSGLFGNATVTVKKGQTQSSTFGGQVTYSSTIAPSEGYQFRETVNMNIVVRLRGTELPEILSATGEATSFYHLQGYCFPVRQAQGSIVFAEFAINDSGLPGDFILYVGAEGTELTADYVPPYDPLVCAQYTSAWNGLLPISQWVGTYVRSGGQIVGIDFNRSFTRENGLSVTSTGRLVPVQ